MIIYFVEVVYVRISQYIGVYTQICKAHTSVYFFEVVYVSISQYTGVYTQICKVHMSMYECILF